MEKVCANCKWFKDGEKSYVDDVCMFNPPVIVVLPGLPNGEAPEQMPYVETRRPRIEQPGLEFCSCWTRRPEARPSGPALDEQMEIGVHE